MSFLSDLFQGNTSALGGDLWGSPTKDLETIGGVLGLGGLGHVKLNSLLSHGIPSLWPGRNGSYMNYCAVQHGC